VRIAQSREKENAKRGTAILRPVAPSDARSLTAPPDCDYSDYMTTTLREAKAKLSQMVKLASRGEEVVITVHGKETAKLVAVENWETLIDRDKWIKRLDKLREKNWTGRYGKTAQQIQDEDRADRF
jgi:prevent-host-death family protein